MSRDRWNAARYAPGAAAGHYESWFLRANDVTGRRAFWIRYTIFAPAGRPDDAVGELWAIAFDRVAAPGAAPIVAVKSVTPMARCNFSRDRLDVTIGDATLGPAALRGEASAKGHTIGWDLTYGGGQAPLLLLPEALYATRLPRAKALVGQPLARFTGTLMVDGDPLVIDDWVGSQNHNWGSRHTDRYAWGQVAGFDEEPDAFLECSTARLRLGPVWTPWMSPVVLRLRGETFAWNALPRAIRANGRYRPYDWTIATRSRAGAVEIRIHGEPAEFVALRYANPPGGAKVCLNSKIARCEVRLRAHGTTTVLTSSRAAFEILEDQAPPGVMPEV